MKKLILAYCIENQYVAAKITLALKEKVDIEKAIFDSNNGIEVLKKAAKDNVTPVLLLISDNFLKSEKCMNDSLAFIQTLGNAQRLIPVTTEGIYPSNTNGQMTTVPTSFDRVSNVIQFMNYWQDRYLELRKIKVDGDETMHNEKVRVVRAISSEIGELLRYFRTMAFFSYDQFKESNYIILYRVLGIEVTKEMEEARKMPVVQIAKPIEVHEVAYSNGIKTPAIPVLIEEKPPVEVAEIPGMAQLAERFNVRDAPISNEKNAAVAKAEQVINAIFEKTLPTEKVINPEIKVEEMPVVKQNNDMPLTLESLIQGIRSEEKVVENEARNPLDKEEDKEYFVAQNTYNQTDKEIPSITGFTLEQIVKDEELNEIMKKQTFNEGVTANFEDVKTSEQTSIASVKEAVLDASDDELVKKIAAETAAETPVLATPIVAEIVENFKEKTDAELTEEVVDEDAIQQEVARVFDAAENENPHFDMESEIAQSIESQKDMVAETPKPVISIPTSTEGEAPSKTLLEYLQEELTADPLNHGLRYKYAAELTNQNRFAEATEHLDILLDNDRKNVDAYVLLAYLAEQQGDFILSLNSLEKVTLLKPDYPGIYYKLGRLTNEHFKKQNRKALRYFKDAVAQDATNADAQYRYGLALIEQNGDFKTAIDHLNLAAEQAPQHDGAIFELAKAYFETNDRANAAKFYARASELNPSFKTESNDQLFHYEEPKPEPIPEPEPTVIDNGMTVLITGATSGIGKATAAIFAKNGYRLILTGRRADRLDALKTEFETEYKNRNQLLNFDVSSLEEVKKAFAKLEEDFQNVDILINNAGLASGMGPIHEGEIEDWERMIDTNIKGLLYVTRAIAPKMVARRKGHIVNLGSIAGKEIYPNGNVYCASKFAVDALTKAMRVDLHKYNIRVSQVAPGAVEETEFSLIRFKGDAEKANIYKDFTPLKASDVAETIYFIVTRPEYVNIQDVVMMGTQQASANHFDRSGRTDVEKE